LRLAPVISFPPLGVDRLEASRNAMSAAQREIASAWTNRSA
jgi:hypothetical protein